MKPYVAIGSRNRTLLTGYALAESYLRKVPGTDCQIEKVLDAANGFAVNLCHETSDRKRIRDLMEREVRTGKYTQAFFDAIDTEYKDDLADIKAFATKDVAKMSNAELVACFDTFYEIYLSTIHPMVLGIYASDLQDVFEAELKKILGNEATQENMLAHTALLLAPSRLSTLQKEEQALFEVESRIHAGDAVSAADFAELEQDFGWFHMEYIGEPRTQEEYRRQIERRVADFRASGETWNAELSPLKRLERTIRDQREFFARHASYAGMDFFTKLVFTLQEYQIVLDYSKADLVEGIYHARPLLQEIGARVGLPSWIDVRFLLPDEIRAFLGRAEKVDDSYIAERKQHWACHMEAGKITVYYGHDAVHIMDELIEKPDVTETKEFKGLTAFPGLVTGTACIVKGAQDREKFKQGSIMVTYDTTTELTSIMKMAAAIVADYGGLLSHTAIVSREFKIPCLVGTKVGTKLVKDGDLIEVDAAKGIVRVLS